MGFDISDLLKANLPDQAPQGMGMLADPQSPAAPQAPGAPAINPVVMRSLAAKYPDAKIPVPDDSSDDSTPAPKTPSAYDVYQSKYGPDAIKKAQADAADQKSGLGWAQFAAGIGDAFAGRSSSQTAQNFDNIRKGIDARTVGALEQQKAGALQDLGAQKTMDANDPNSRQSQAFQQAVKTLYKGKFTDDQIANLSAADSELLMKPLELDAKIKETADNHQALRETRNMAMMDRAGKQQDQAMGKTMGMLESARGSPAVGQAEKDLYAVDKVNSMVNLYGDPNKLNPQQVQLLASEVAKIASGGVPTEHELQGLNPSTIPSSLAGLAQKLTNSPTPARAGEFVKAMQDYTNSLQKDAQKVIQDKYGRVIDSSKKQIGDSNYQTLQDKYVNRFAAQPRAAANPSPEDQQAIAWAKANPQDPRAKQIMSMHGGQ